LLVYPSEHLLNFLLLGYWGEKSYVFAFGEWFIFLVSSPYLLPNSYQYPTIYPSTKFHRHLEFIHILSLLRLCSAVTESYKITGFTKKFPYFSWLRRKKICAFSILPLCFFVAYFMVKLSLWFTIVDRAIVIIVLFVRKKKKGVKKDIPSFTHTSWKWKHILSYILLART
jgi:hypothetical protein